MQKISIIIPTYNRAHLISETLLSIQNQSHSDFECLIVDDGSTDNSEEVISNFLNDKRFFYFKRDTNYKKGPSGCRNFGIDNAKGEFIHFFDDDDIMHEDCLKNKLTPLLENINLVLAISKFKYFNNNDLLNFHEPNFNFNHSHLGESILLGKMLINNCNSLWSKKVFNELRFDEELLYSEEWELFTRIGFVYPNQFCYVEESLSYYRKHPNTSTTSFNLEKEKVALFIRIKLLKFLNNNILHTKSSVLFMTKTFSINQFNKFYLLELKEYVNKHLNSKRLKYYIDFSIFTHKIYSKFLNKIASWL